MTPMQERAAKVAVLPFTKHEHDAFAAICFTAMRTAKEFTPARSRLSFEDLRTMSKALADLMLNWQAERTARKENLQAVYNPDLTRAALEECVRAMERVQRFLNFGDGETFNVIGYVDEAIATARNALQGE